MDGGRGHKVTNSSKFGFWRPSGSPEGITINYILLSGFLGGSDLADYGHAEDTYAWFDEIKVSRVRINEYNRFKDPAAGIGGRGFRESGHLRPIPGREGVFRLRDRADWRVYSLSGKPVSRGRGTVVDLSRAPRGVYFLKSGVWSYRFHR